MILAINVTYTISQMNTKVKKYETTERNEPLWYEAYVRVYGSKDLRLEMNVPMMLISEIDCCRRALSESKQIDDERFLDEVQNVEGACALFQVSCAARRWKKTGRLRGVSCRIAAAIIRATRSTWTRSRR